MRDEALQLARVVARDGLGMVRRRALSRRFVQRVDEAPGPAKVIVGAGGVRMPGWISTDITWNGDNWLDLSRPWPVGRDRIGLIYADNVIEHFTLSGARLALRYAYDALVPGGRIRLATPDAEATVRAYLDDPELTRQHLDRHRRHGFTAEHPVDMVRLTYAHHGHHAGYIYDEDALGAELRRAGFEDVTRWAAGESGTVELRGLETRIEPSEIATELVMEGRKPG
jgi:predicted SAM-dependent methyltransferase